MIRVVSLFVIGKGLIEHQDDVNLVLILSSERIYIIVFFQGFLC